MGNKRLYTWIYEILDDFRLLNLDEIDRNIKKLGRPGLEAIYGELEKHYEKNRYLIFQEIRTNKFNVYPSYFCRDEKFLRAACLYVDKLVINDPLYMILESFMKNSYLSLKGVKYRWNLLGKDFTL